MVKVNAFDLGEAFYYKAGAFAVIRFNIENQAIVHDLVAFQCINEFIHIPFFEHVKPSFPCFSSFFFIVEYMFLCG